MNLFSIKYTLFRGEREGGGEFMSRILVLSRYYPPEVCVAGTCVSEIATRLARLGHVVTVLTAFPNYPTGVVPAEYRGQLVRREVIDGVEVVRVWCYIAPNRGFARRVLAQLSFGFTAALLGWNAVNRPDMIILGSPPLFNVIGGRMLARLKGCPFIFMVADLWPEAAIQLGALRNRFFIRLSEWLEWSTYRKARRVWVVTEGMRETLLSRGLPARQMFLLTYGVDCAKFHPRSREEARAALGWESRFTALYAGGHGASHGLSMVLDAAAYLLAHEDIQILLVGDGGEKAELMEQAQRRGLKNVTFLPGQPHECVPILMAAADVCLVPVCTAPIFQGARSVKMYEAMACGRPMVLAMDGEARQIVEHEAGAALYAPPGDGRAMAEAILRLYRQPELREEMGRRGRAYAEAHCDYDHLTVELHTCIEMLLGKATPGVVPVTPVAGVRSSG